MADTAPKGLTAQQERLLAEGLAALVRGWNITPLNGKKPLLEGWSKRPKPTPELVRGWVEQGHNLGVVTGATSGVDVIDDDTADGSAEAKLAIPPTPTVRTGSGRRHHYIKHVEGVRNSASKLAEGVDVRGDGGQVVLPGSKHPITGKEYAWEDGRSPSDLPFAQVPTALVEKARSSTKSSKRGSRTEAWARAALTKETDQVRKAPEGSRNDTLNVASFNLGQITAGGHLAEREVREALLGAAVAAGLPEAEALATIESGMQAGMLEPRTPKGESRDPQETADKHEPLTDTGNAERFAKRANGDLLYSFVWNKWLYWTSRRWTIDTSGAAMRLSKAVARSFYRLAAECNDAEIAKSYSDFARKTEKVERRKAMVELAKSEHGMSVSPAQLDQHPMLFNCTNGTLDLRSLALRPHRREDLLTKLCTTSYKPEAKCPRFLEFLERILPDPEIREYVKRFCGYSLTGDVSEQVLQIGVGGGLNGKSTLYCAIQNVIGASYAIQIASELLLAKDRDSHPTELADLFGVRLAIGTETPRGRVLNEALVKVLTGGELIRARRMREDFTQFQPSHKLVLVTNDMPRVETGSFAIARRLHVVPFDVRIQPHEIDKRLPQKLKAESEGILTWCVEGCREWLERGLDPPEGVLIRQTKLQIERRPIEEFVASIVVRKRGSRTRAADVYAAFVRWCEQECKPIASQTDLGIALGNEGFGKQKSAGAMIYLDMALQGPGEPIQGQLGIGRDSSPVDPSLPPHEGVKEGTVPSSPQPSPRADSCHACSGSIMWRRVPEGELFCMRCAQPATGIPVHEILDIATGVISFRQEQESSPGKYIVPGGDRA